jgi:hypothetical protein
MSFGVSAGVLDVFEAERLVECLEPTTPRDVGSSSWLEQHRALDRCVTSQVAACCVRFLICRLNVQAHHNVVSQTDEFVIEALISFEKLPVTKRLACYRSCIEHMALQVIVHELILIETWKYSCMPKLEEDFVATKSNVKPYLMVTPAPPFPPNKL